MYHRLFAVRARATDFGNIEAARDAENAWVGHVNEVSGYTLFQPAIPGILEPMFQEAARLHALHRGVGNYRQNAMKLPPGL